MKVNFIVVGKTNKYIKEGILEYQKRLRKYINFEIIEIPALKNSKNLSKKEQKNKEAVLLEKYLGNCNNNILLDENGKHYSSIEFAELIKNKTINSQKCVNFIVGGPYGFSDELLYRRYQKMALSKMTFSHQMVRLFFVEQIYRAMTIIKGEPYHH